MKKILIVEDEPHILEVITVTLEFGPYQLFTATNVDQALEIGFREIPDMVITDVMLPGEKSGIDICKSIKEAHATKNAYVIIMSAKGQVRDIQAGKDAGCDEYIVKPFSPIELIDKVSRILD